MTTKVIGSEVAFDSAHVLRHRRGRLVPIGPSVGTAQGRLAGRVDGVSVDPATSDFLRACRREPVDRRPVWFMRQAGRSLPEYRRLRGDGSILEAIRKPDLATELTLQPIRRYGVDAAILFSDIMVPVEAIGFGVDIVPGIGPVVEAPFTGVADLERLRPLDPEADTPYVLETVRNLSSELDVPLIGFAGAPFTVASYLVEGRPSRNHQRTKSLMYTEPDLWHRLMERLTDIALASLRSQTDAGATALQVFDSWVGTLSPVAYRQFVFPHTERLLAELASTGVPRILFGVDTGELLASFVEAGADVVGIDWRVPLDVAVERTGSQVALQGNLDPSVCLAPWPVVEAEVRDVLTRARTAPGHVFNLGHGVMPEIDPSILELVVALVHDEPV